MNKNIKKQFLLILLIGVLCIGLGTSYALFRINLSGTKDIVFITDTLSMKFDESMNGNHLTLGSEYPTEDVIGKQMEPYMFTLTNTGTQAIDYDLYLDDLEITSGKERVSDHNVRFQLKDDQSLDVIKNLNETGISPNRKLMTGTLKPKESKTYKLRLWLDIQAGNEAQNKSFASRIRVEAVSIPEYVFADQSGASAPELEENMIPVKYDETSQNWIKADARNPENNPWYNYNQKQWANAVTVDQSKVLDLSGKNNNGTIHGATVTSGQASLDGVDDYIDCGLANYEFGSHQTMMIRLKIHSLNAEKYTVFFSNFELSGSGFFYDKQLNKLSFQIHNGKEYMIAAATYDFTFDQLYTLVGSYDGENVKFYIDGKLVATTPYTGNISSSPFAYLIGGNPNQNGDGVIVHQNSKITTTEALIFERTLSDQEVKEYSQNGTKGRNKEGLLLHYNFKKGNEIEIGSPISMDAINTMMVWVPRYKYVMPAAKEGQIDIVFENKKTAKSTGTATGTSYLTHSAFTFGTTELNGLWVGKFESSSDITCTPSNGSPGTNCDLTTIHPQVKPNVKSWTGARVSTFFTASRNVQTAGNPYGYSQSGMNTHMMKNSEWGAVAYLTQSKYGRCTNGTCTEVTMNNLNSGDGRTITGCAADTITASELRQADCPDTNRYNTKKGVLASTTANVYGVYDMAGGDWEYVMGNYNNYSGYTAISYTKEQAATILGRTDDIAVGVWNSGFNGPIYGKALDNTTTLSWTTGIDFPEQKYYDLYTTMNVETSCNGNKCLGHALSETAGWYGDYQYHVSSSHPWFVRGAAYNDGSYAGVLAFGSEYGRSYGTVAFRLVMSKE